MRAWQPVTYGKVLLTGTQGSLPAPTSLNCLPSPHGPKRTRGTMNIRWMSSLCLVSFLLLLGSLGTLRALGQCAGIATTPTVAADCAGHAVPQNRVATIDPSHPYTL